jgi:hypothetical protein
MQRLDHGSFLYMLSFLSNETLLLNLSCIHTSMHQLIHHDPHVWSQRQFILTSPTVSPQAITLFKQVKIRSIQFRNINWFVPVLLELHTVLREISVHFFGSLSHSSSDILPPSSLIANIVFPELRILKYHCTTEVYRQPFSIGDKYTPLLESLTVSSDFDDEEDNIRNQILSLKHLKHLHEFNSIHFDNDYLLKLFYTLQLESISIYLDQSNIITMDKWNQIFNTNHAQRYLKELRVFARDIESSSKQIGTTIPLQSLTIENYPDEIQLVRCCMHTLTKLDIGECEFMDTSSIQLPKLKSLIMNDMSIESVIQLLNVCGTDSLCTLDVSNIYYSSVVPSIRALNFPNLHSFYLYDAPFHILQCIYPSDNIIYTVKKLSLMEIISNEQSLPIIQLNYFQGIERFSSSLQPFLTLNNNTLCSIKKLVLGSFFEQQGEFDETVFQRVLECTKLFSIYAYGMSDLTVQNWLPRLLAMNDNFRKIHFGRIKLNATMDMQLTSRYESLKHLEMDINGIDPVVLTSLFHHLPNLRVFACEKCSIQYSLYNHLMELVDHHDQLKHLFVSVLIDQEPSIYYNLNRKKILSNISIEIEITHDHLLKHAVIVALCSCVSSDEYGFFIERTSNGGETIYNCQVEEVLQLILESNIVNPFSLDALKTLQQQKPQIKIVDLIQTLRGQL